MKNPLRHIFNALSECRKAYLGQRLLHVAGRRKMWYWRRNEKVEDLIEKGAQVDMRDSRGRTPLMRCLDVYLAFREDTSPAETIRQLIEYGGCDLTLKDKSGQTALDRARQMGGRPQGKEILDMIQNAKPQHLRGLPCKLGKHLLRVIDERKEGYEEKALTLITAGADLGQMVGEHKIDMGIYEQHYGAPHGETAVDLCLTQSNTKILAAILDQKQMSQESLNRYMGDCLLHRDIKLVKIFLDAGADANAISHFNEHPTQLTAVLMYCNAIDKEDRLKLLLEHGADPEKESEDSSAISFAKFQRKDDIVALFSTWTRDAKDKKHQEEMAALDTACHSGAAEARTIPVLPEIRKKPFAAIAAGRGTP